jgi:hypothetical protein
MGMMHQLSTKSKREKGQYKALPLIHGQGPGQVNADKRGSEQTILLAMLHHPPKLERSIRPGSGSLGLRK